MGEALPQPLVKGNGCMKMVTYLLGAGASAKALPVAGKIEENLNVLLGEEDGSLGKAIPTVCPTIPMTFCYHGGEASMGCLSLAS
jgi:hypothetical protein